MTKRIGFACKFMNLDQTLTKSALEEIQRPLNTKTTTIKWLNSQTKPVAEQRLWNIMVHNIQAVENLIRYVGQLPLGLRMVRLTSDILPAYSENTWKYFWQQTDVKNYCERHFALAGEIARTLDVRLSMHPGQFVVLASDREDVVKNSIKEFEYHSDMFRWMGYGKKFQDFKCNVHISGKKGPAGILSVLPKLSPEARNCITIENDENGWGLDASLELAKDVALVVDIHHHWVRTGEYIQPTDDRYLRTIDSWRGAARPVIHYSYSRDEHLPENFTHREKPDMNLLLETGRRRQKLRAHSDYFPNNAVNDWALSFLETADIMCESKKKNIASVGLWEYSKGVDTSAESV